MKTKHIATIFAILAAALYAINIPLSKILLTVVSPTIMAAFLYLGAGLGLFIYGILTGEREKSDSLTIAELPYTIGMILLDIAAPILLMIGLETTNSANASLLNNFEIVATSLIAFFAFKELLSKRLTLAIILVTIASITLSFEGQGSFQFNTGSLLVLAASCCWGLENNCTHTNMCMYIPTNIVTVISYIRTNTNIFTLIHIFIQKAKVFMGRPTKISRNITTNIASKYYNSLITFAGTPASNTLSSKDFFTTAPEATTTLSPSVTPGLIVTFPPIQQF